MSETVDKINKLATQHKVIGAKKDCPHFSTIGNLCSRVQNGMMRCDEYLECEFKYIDALKEENENLKQQLEIDKNQINYFIEENENLKEENATLREFLNQYQEEVNALKSYETYKVWLNNE